MSFSYGTTVITLLCDCDFMKSSRKKILLITGIIFLSLVVYGLFEYYKPTRDVKQEEGIRITAEAIFDSFTVNENRANQVYLNKAIEVSGIVADIKKNQEGNAVVYLKTSDPIFGVNCTFKENPDSIVPGSNITFKGICTGYLSDVIINQGIIVKK